MGCVYSLFCVPTQKRYIGKTTRSLLKRMIQHRHRAQTSPLPLYNAVRKYGWDSFEISELCSMDDDKGLLLAEQQYIKFYDTMYPFGYNMTPGGEGVCNPQFSEVWREKNKLRAQKMGKAVYCLETDTIYKSVAEAARAEGVASMTVSYICRSSHHRSKGRHYCFASEKECERLRQLALTGELYNSPPTTHFGKANGSSRAVRCIETSQVFDTIDRAARSVGGKHGSCIVNCCRGKTKTAYGYHWQYVDSPSIEKDD